MAFKVSTFLEGPIVLLSLTRYNPLILPQHVSIFTFAEYGTDLILIVPLYN